MTYDILYLVNLSDKTALPCPDDGEVYSLWYMCIPEEEQSGKLKGSLIGQVHKTETTS